MDLDAEPEGVAAGPDDPTGRWVNAGGTVIDLARYPDGRLAGAIRFATDGTRYQPYPIKGTCIVGSDGRCSIVGTVAGWPHPAAVTVWCGELGADGTTLNTDLLMAAGSAGPLDVEAATGGTAFRRARPDRRSAFRRTLPRRRTA